MTRAEKLLRFANDPAATLAERAAYRRKAMELLEAERKPKARQPVACQPGAYTMTWQHPTPSITFVTHDAAGNVTIRSNCVIPMQRD